MFDQLKQLKKAKQIQDSLRGKEVKVEREGIIIVMDGTMRVKEIKISSNLEKEKQEAVLMDLINEAMGKVQMMAAKEISQMGDFGL